MRYHRGNIGLRNGTANDLQRRVAVSVWVDLGQLPELICHINQRSHHDTSTASFLTFAFLMASCSTAEEWEGFIYPNKDDLTVRRVFERTER